MLKTLCLFFTGTVSSTALAQETFSPAPPKPWRHASEISVEQNDGNSKNESRSIKQTTSYNFDPTLVQVSASYLKSSVEDVNTHVRSITARRWDSNLRLERAVSPLWSNFADYKVESDRFAGFTQRHTTSVGAKYFLVKKENNNFFGELGPTYVHENQVSGDQIHHTGARLYIEANYAFNQYSAARLWVQYKPNFSDTDDYLIDYEASLSSAISTVFSLKVSYLSKYDNKPAAPERQDSTLKTAIVAKF